MTDMTYLVPYDSTNLALFEDTRKQSKTDKKKEIGSLEAAKDAQCNTAAGIHVRLSENTSSLNAEGKNL